MYEVRKIVIEESESKDTFFCNVCGFPLASQEDFEASSSYKCCHECYLTYAEATNDKWKKGWRPDKTQIEQYIYMRKKTILGEKNES